MNPNFTNDDLEYLLRHPSALITWCEPDEKLGDKQCAITVAEALNRQRAAHSATRGLLPVRLMRNDDILTDFLLIHWATPLKLNNNYVHLS